MPSPQIAEVPVAEIAEEVLMGISFPRCCICETGWYDEINLDSSGNAGGQSSNKRKRNRSRPSHDVLLPMPACQCTTKLVLPSSVPNSVYSEKECSDHMSTIIQIQTHTFSNLAICKSCLEQRIKASSEVTVHDYRQEHIPNGQQNVKFTVEPDCVQCKRKFMGRQLERLLSSSNNNNNGNNNSTSRGKGKTNTINWSEAIKSTIDVVGWIKREKRRDRKNRRKTERERGAVENGNTLNSNEQRKTLWKSHNNWCDGNGSSDDCYSYSSESSNDDDDDQMDYQKKGPHRVESTRGELANYLAEKDPKFKRALEDEQFVKKLAEEEEKNRKKALEARAKEDLEIAMKLQAEEEENNKKKVGGGKFEPRKTRTGQRSPILEAMKKASTMSESSTAKQPSSGLKVAQHMIPASKPAVNDEGKNGATPASVQVTKDATKQPKEAHNMNDVNDESAKVREIVSMGFVEESARRCLKDSKGNVEMAISMLISEAAATESPTRNVERREIVRVVFTGFVPTRQHLQMIQTIGAEIVESIEKAHTATHIIVTDGTTKLRRTPKLMICLCKSPNILKLEWLEQSAKEQTILDTTPYLLIDDKEAEKRYRFSMKATIQNGIKSREKGGVLQGWSVYICSGVAGNHAPSAKELKLIIEAAGGKVAERILHPDKTIVVTSSPSTPSQRKEPGVQNVSRSCGKVVSTSWLFDVMITQCINPVIEVDD